MEGNANFSILIAEDDEDDYLLIVEALENVGVHHKLERVRDGNELIAFLQKNYLTSEKKAVKPGLIFLDLEMPVLDGREALKVIKGDSRYNKIPVIVLSASQTTDDVDETYDLGANSFVHKPPRFQDFVASLKVASSYWLDTVKLPQ